MNKKRITLNLLSLNTFLFFLASPQITFAGDWDTTTNPPSIFYSGGNVGIGTTNPSSQLVVNNVGSSSITARIGGVYPGVTSNGTRYYKQFQVSEPTYNIPSGITDNGYRIGLATQGYVNSADFSGTLKTQMGAWIRTGAHSENPTGTIENSYALLIDNLTAPNVTIENSYGIFQNHASAKNYFAGDIGIGTQSPKDKLHVINGGISLGKNQDSYDFTFVTDNPDSPGIRWSYDGYTKSSAKITTIGTNSYVRKGLAFYTNNFADGTTEATEKMRITDAGNVGIGTTSPQSKLAVNGTITTKEVKVEDTGWSDFVFGDDYSLPSLDKVESFIKENKHLPDIPSEKEIEENGLSMADMMVKQMQKIEELTLYIIAQKKNIENLEKRLNDNQEKLKDLIN